MASYEKTCKICDAPFTAGRRDAGFCSDRCRKASYSVPCADCGKPLSGSDGRGPNAPTRCVPCAARLSGVERRVWTHDAIVARIREWNDTYGEPPASPDWMPARARINNDEERARRFERADGYWPCGETVHHRFGSWNAALKAAGFEPRAAHGGAGNQLRKRAAREAVAA